jgi:uncharacterized coiled-coil protein SlyX
MDVKEALRSFFKEIVLPEIQDIKTEQIKITERLNSVDQRLADINLHLADQSRRIDETNKRIDETNKRIDSVRDELVSMIGETNKRIDRLYEVIVRRDEHSELVIKVIDLEKRIVGLEGRLAA